VSLLFSDGSGTYPLNNIIERWSMGGSHCRLWTERFVGLDFLHMFSIGGAGEGRHLRWLFQY
jgi:hypothetical protein